MTRRQHLKKLPLAIRLKAMENIRLYWPEGFNRYLDEYDEYFDLCGAFGWAETKQGLNYWNNVDNQYFS